MSRSRREFVAGLAAVATAAAWPRANRAEPTGAPLVPSAQENTAARLVCPFRLSVINDEISQDFDLACSIASRDFGLQWIELRSMWNKNVTELKPDEIASARQILDKYMLRVTDIASPLFKTDWPGAPISKESPQHDQFHAGFDFKQQDDLLKHCIQLAQTFRTDRIRCFDFWRLEDVKPYRAAINRKLSEAAHICGKSNLLLVLENEMACNTATGEEAAETLAGVPESNFLLNWDPGNAATFANNTPYPNGYNLLPKHRIGHCHAKDVSRKPDGKWEWAPVGGGVVDWVGQLKALQHDGYQYAVSLETHWRGAGTPEASTRISMKGLKEALSHAGIRC